MRVIYFICFHLLNGDFDQSYVQNSLENCCFQQSVAPPLFNVWILLKHSNYKRHGGIPPPRDIIKQPINHLCP